MYIEQLFVFLLLLKVSVVKNNSSDCCLIRFNVILLCTIWCEMTEDHKRLLAVFEVRVRDLMALCDKQKRKIDELGEILNLKDDELQQTKNKINELNAKFDNMLTARVVSISDGDIKSARTRLSKLVREVDKCIALLNE